MSGKRYLGCGLKSSHGWADDSSSPLADALLDGRWRGTVNVLFPAIDDHRWCS